MNLLFDFGLQIITFLFLRNKVLGLLIPSIGIVDVVLLPRINWSQSNVMLLPLLRNHCYLCCGDRLVTLRRVIEFEILVWRLIVGYDSLLFPFSFIIYLFLYLKPISTNFKTFHLIWFSGGVHVDFSSDDI